MVALYRLLLAFTASATAGAYEAYECATDTELGTVVAPSTKGIAVDDSTLRWCASRVPEKWPNAPNGESTSQLASIRLFKAWDPTWEADGRVPAWESLRDYAEATNAKILIGTPVSCDEADDEMFWGWTKELLQMLRPEHVLGLAIGNELELLQFKYDISDVTPACVAEIWDGGYLWRRFQHVVTEFDALGFSSVPVTSVFTGMGLAGNPFYEVPNHALVNTFMRNVTTAYGHRFAFTWNLYPYFDPNLRRDEGTSDQCSFALGDAACWGSNCQVPRTMRDARLKMQSLTGRDDSILWIGETGWSHPRSGSLNTDLENCPEWSAMSTFENYYRGFLSWDLDIGNGMRPPDHVFWFTMRDSNNFGQGEHFGLISTCTAPTCKIRSSGFEAEEYSEVASGNQFCGDAPLYDNFAHSGPEECRDRCTLDSACTHYSLWNTDWCKLTAGPCTSRGTSPDHTIQIFAKVGAATTTTLEMTTTTEALEATTTTEAPSPETSPGPGTSGPSPDTTPAAPGTTPEQRGTTPTTTAGGPAGTSRRPVPSPLPTGGSDTGAGVFLDPAMGGASSACFGGLVWAACLAAFISR